VALAWKVIVTTLGVGATIQHGPLLADRVQYPRAITAKSGHSNRGNQNKGEFRHFVLKFDFNSRPAAMLS